MAASTSPLYTCKCLNVKIHPRNCSNVPNQVVDPRVYPDLRDDQLSQKIFEGSTEVAEIELDVGGVRHEQPLLFSSTVVGNWSFFHCLNCKTATHCCRFSSASIKRSSFGSSHAPASPTEHVMLVNITHMISDNKKIQQLSQSQDFSPLFRIILPTTWGSQTDRWNTTTSPIFSPTSPQNSQAKPPSRRISSYPSPSTQTEQTNPIFQVVTSTLHHQLQKYLQEEEVSLERRIKKFEEEEREAFEAKAEKARRDRTYLLNLIRSSSLDDSSAVRTLRSRHVSGGARGEDGPKSRRESAPTKPINIASPSVNYPGIPTAFSELGSPVGGVNAVYGGLVEIGGGGPSPGILNPVTLTLPQNAPMSRLNNNYQNFPSSNPTTPRDGSTSSPTGLFSMDDDSGQRHPEVEEEELEELGDPGDCSPFEPIESSDTETDPDDNSLEDLRRDNMGKSFIPTSSLNRERKLSKYSTSAPMNIAAFPQMTTMRDATVDVALQELDSADEEIDAAEEPNAAAPEPDPAQIAASMQALAMSHRDEDDPEAIFGERPRRRLNTLELYQIRQFKRPGISKQNSANAQGLEDFTPGGPGF